MGKNEINKGVLEGTQKILFYPVLMKHFGVIGALLIQQVHYWSITKGREHDGHLWAYNSLSSLAEQLMMSRSAVANTIRDLESGGILASGSFNKANYDRTKWYRVNYESLSSKLGEDSIELLYRITDHEAPRGKFIVAHKIDSKISRQSSSSAERTAIVLPEVRHSPAGGTTIPRSSLKIRLKTKSKTSIAKTGDAINCTDSLETGGKVVMAPKQKVVSSANDILKNFQAAKSGKPIPEKVSPVQIELFWKKTVSQLEGVSFVKSFTAVQLGQCKHLINSVGFSNVYGLLDCVLNNWIPFVKFVEQAAGIKTTPSVPDIGFLLKHSGHAMNFMAARVKSPSKAPVKTEKKDDVPGLKGKKLFFGKKTVTPEPAPVQSTAPEAEEDDVASVDFLDKLMGNLGED